MRDKKKQMILIVLAVLSLVLITVGVTYAFFNYAKEGSTDNTLTTGVITFIYEEVDQQGSGISIKDAFPMSDGNGKIQEGAGKVFNFKVTSQTPTTQSIPYTITARKSVNSTLNDEVVKVFLKEVSTTDTELLLDVYKELDDYANAPEGITEKIIHTDTVPAGTQNWNKEYELRLWISEEADYTDATVNGQTFTITVNVYANSEVVTNVTYNAEQTTYINENTECTDISCSLNELYDLTK